MKTVSELKKSKTAVAMDRFLFCTFSYTPANKAQHKQKEKIVTLFEECKCCKVEKQTNGSIYKTQTTLRGKQKSEREFKQRR